MRKETILRRQEILKAALLIFGSKGFSNGSLADIAEQVGMTHAGVLHHFGSKDQLLLEVLAYRDHSDVQDLVNQHIPDGNEFFEHLIKTADHNSERPGIIQAFAVLSAESVTADNPGRKYFTDRYQQLRAEGVQALEVMCADRGITDPKDLKNAAAAVLAAMDGLQVQWLLNPDEVDLGRASEFAIRAIVAAIMGPEK